MKRIIITLAISILPISSVFAKEADLATITAAIEAKDHAQAIQLAQAAATAEPVPAALETVLFEAGAAELNKMKLENAAAYFRLFVDKFPESENASAARAELVACYNYLRKLDECIAQAKVNLKLDPDSKWVEYWEFLIPQSQFRLWDYENAKPGLEAFLKKHPNGEYAKHAKSCLEKIDPSWEIDENGIVAYSGKYDGDIRLEAVIRSLPKDLDAAFAELKESLGIERRPHTNVIYEFRDGGAKGSSGLKASTFVVGIKNKPAVVIRFYSETVVSKPEGYRKTLVHELKHAGFQGIMGHSYSDLPHWIREGLAVWGSNDVETRLQLVLCNEIIAKKDPLAVLDGIEDPEHDVKDYMEDALAFEWLESKNAGNVKAFCKRLGEGEDYQKIWADLSGMEYGDAMAEADAHCKKRVEAALGGAYTAFKNLRDTLDTAANAGKPAAEKWLSDGGEAELTKWLADNEANPAAPFARFCLARVLITAGRNAEGRAPLQRIKDGDSLRSSMLDDAQLWIGVSYNWEKDSANAREAFGVLLRDYPASSSAKQVAGKFPAAGPVTN